VYEQRPTKRLTFHLTWKVLGGRLVYVEKRKARALQLKDFTISAPIPPAPR
jgi:hypothetical protein